MKRYTASEARESFAKILDQVEQGEEVQITKHGLPVATITRPKNGKKQEIPAAGWGLKEGWSYALEGDFNEIPEGFEKYI